MCLFPEEVLFPVTVEFLITLFVNLTTLIGNGFPKCWSQWYFLKFPDNNSQACCCVMVMCYVLSASSWAILQVAILIHSSEFHVF